MLYRHVCPVIPRRYAHLLREFVDAKDGASAVAASNDELTIYERDDKLFTFALQQISVDALLFHQLVDGCRMADGAYEDSWSGCVGFFQKTGIRSEGGCCSTHTFDIFQQGMSSIAHSLAVVGVHVDFYPVIGIQQQVSLLEIHKSVGCAHADS